MLEETDSITNDDHRSSNHTLLLLAAVINLSSCLFFLGNHELCNSTRGSNSVTQYSRTPTPNFEYSNIRKYEILVVVGTHTHTHTLMMTMHDFFAWEVMTLSPSFAPFPLSQSPFRKRDCSLISQDGVDFGRGKKVFFSSWMPTQAELAPVSAQRSPFSDSVNSRATSSPCKLLN